MHDLEELFRLGPPRRLARFVRASRPPFVKPMPRVLLVLAAGWLPLFVLTAVRAPEQMQDLVRDIAVHARYAVATPLLVVAYSSCGRRLGVIVGNFARAGLLDAAGRQILTEQIAASRRLLQSRAAEVVAVVLAAASAAATLSGLSISEEMAAWTRNSGANALSMAGLWQFAISLPLLLTLWFGWLWRIAVWARLLIRISRLDLDLIASHPDQCGGLGFLGQSLRAFSTFAMALGAISAGRLGHNHLAGTSSTFTDGVLAGGTVAVVVLLCVAPLCAFSDRMMQTWRRGSMAYGALATQLGMRLEAAWIDRGDGRDDGRGDGRPPILEAPDFSAAADLFAVVGSVQTMRFIPVDTRSLVMLVTATLLPFVAALFLTMPFDVVLETLKNLLI
ncbi:MAG: hypothetical protein DI555_05670 [Novosphingobium pentaromativorans]|uniref:Uncharacterized protein n=1 Tax=Novosphingobium pentaromativorans TaxID=205844 RepID=A0A2W5P007_9SPHN|nr:hypothetical protein [Novosphingobium panipatense]PZQ56125.1 MAG: hypothetical protein DI555_05670 [Novosphingobium pentaromativorans]